MRYVQYAAIILFCLWTLAMIPYSLVQLRSYEREQERAQERFARTMRDLESKAASFRRELPDERGEEGEGETDSWVDAVVGGPLSVAPAGNSWLMAGLGALWFFPAFFFLCVFLFAGIRRSPRQAKNE